MHSEKKYCRTWGASQYNSIGNLPDISLKNTSLRQIIKTSIKGDSLNFHFSNFLGESELEIKAAHVAFSKSQGSGQIITSSDTEITFNGKTSIIVPPYSEIVSDDINFSAPALSELAITISLGNIPETITGHVGSRTFSYIEPDNDITKECFGSEHKTPHWYFLSGIDVESNNNEEAIVCFGDSITDGRGTTDDKQNRWTDIFSERLQKNPSTANLAVINQGIGGTCVTTNGVERFTRDVLNQTGIKKLILLYGVNDILFLNSSAETIIKTYQNIIDRVHKLGISVYGGTILPFGKNDGWTQEKEEVRLTVNNWIKENSSGNNGFDGFIDFASPMLEPGNKLNLNPEWNFENDGLHPNALGYNTMGNTIDLNLFAK